MVSRSDWLKAIGVWAFAVLWIVLFVGGLFNARCLQTRHKDDSRLRACERASVLIGWLPSPTGKTAMRDLEHAILRARASADGAADLIRSAYEDALAAGPRRTAELHRRIEGEPLGGPARDAWRGAGLPIP